MPAPSIGRRHGWLPPGAQVDPTHPLAAGLRFCLVGDRWVDLVSGKRPSITGQAGSRTLFGPARHFNGTAGASIPLDLSGGDTATVGAVVRWPTFANDDDLLCELSDNSNSNDGFFIDPNWSGSGGKFGVKWRIAGGDRTYTFDRPSTSNVDQTWVVRMTRASDADVWFNGAAATGKTAGGLATQSGATFPNTTFYLASRTAAFLLADVHITLMCVWVNRLEGASSLAAAFHADPFQMLRG